MQIDVTYNDVTILGTTIKRPSSIAPSQWLLYWEAVGRQRLL